MPDEHPILACDMTALTAVQRSRHAVATQRFLTLGRRDDLPDGFRFTLDRADFPAADLAEWVADEARCCPAVSFRLELPASGKLTLYIGGDAAVKMMLAAELGLPDAPPPPPDGK